MGRERRHNYDAVVAAVLAGAPPKQVAHETRSTQSYITNVLNRLGIYKHYLTPSEVRLVQSQRRKVA